MCGRYAQALVASQIIPRLRNNHMPIDYWPDDGDTRPTYNFAPGYYGLVYRQNVSGYGAGARQTHETAALDNENNADGTGDDQTVEDESDGEARNGYEEQSSKTDDTSCSPKNKRHHYKLQPMKWGLVPFWTKRNPDYGSMMKTINCRDDSLASSGGMWTTMKHQKRCVVIAQGFFEWLKKNNGKDKIPHFVKRKDEQLMCFAGLWDCVQYEDSAEKLYSYTIITTDSNKQLNFLHDRMPVILNNGSKEMFRWLDAETTEWNAELQELLRPFNEELECYQVRKEVGKVGNDSPSFIVPLDSPENKQNIANFFGNQRKWAMPAARHGELKQEPDGAVTDVKYLESEVRGTKEGQDSENNAPEPTAPPSPTRSTKRGPESLQDSDTAETAERLSPAAKAQKTSETATPESNRKAVASTPSPSPRKPRSATGNSPSKNPAGSPAAKGAAAGSLKITSFFQK